MIPDIPYDDILTGRVCIDLLRCGISGENGSHPLCLGQQCSTFEACLLQLIDARKKLHETKPTTGGFSLRDEK